MIHFDGRVAVVTGGAGGLGRTYCLDLAARGARVVVNDLGAAVDGSTRDLAPANAVVAEIEAAGGTAIVSPHSVSTPEGGEAIVADAIAAFGRVDVVISNAGTLRDRTFAKLDWPDLDAVLDAAGGRYARVFAGLTPGWVGGPNATAAEDIAAHVDDITALDGYIVPLSVQDEFVQLRRALGLPTVEDARW